MVNFNKSFLKCLAELYSETEYAFCISKERVFNYKGEKISLYAPEHEDNILIGRVKTHKRNLDMKIAETLEAVEHKLRGLDDDLVETGLKIIPAHVRDNLTPLVLPKENRPYETAFKAMIEGLSESNFSVKDDLLKSCPTIDRLADKLIKHIDESFNLASKGTTVALNKNSISPIIGFHYEQSSRFIGLKPLSFNTLDLFPYKEEISRKKQLSVGISEPELYRTEIKHIDKNATFDLFKEVGNSIGESDFEGNLVKKTANALIDILNEQLLKQLTPYEKKVRFAPQFNEIKLTAKQAIKTNTLNLNFLRTPHPSSIEENYDLTDLKEKAYIEADIARDLLQAQSAEVIVSFGDTSYSTQANNKGTLDKSYERGGEKRYMPTEITDDHHYQKDISLELDR